MSGSWNQDGGSRRLINELKAAWRMHRKQVDCQTVALDLPAIANPFVLSTKTDTFGGVMALPKATVLSPDVTFMPVVATMPPAAQPKINKISCLPSVLPVYSVKALCRAGLNIASCPVGMDKAISRVQACPQLLKTKVFCIASAQFLLRRPVNFTRISVKCFDKAEVTHSVSLLATKIRLWQTQRAPLVIIRKPIPPHRFSQAQRNYFRMLLAQKSQLQTGDIKLAGIYDRLVLEAFQALSPLPDGSLACTPKATYVPDETLPPQLVYIVMGRSLLNPNQVFQVLVPMTELNQ